VGLKKNRFRAATAAAFVLVALGLTAGGTGAKSQGDYSPGSPGLGDSYFPLYGNGGYDVKSYWLDIRYDPGTDELVGHARITAVPTQNLSRFNLDFVGLTLNSLTVQGLPATWTRDDHELAVTPRFGLPRGQRFIVDARYTGVPETFLVPGTPIETGHVRTDDGADFWGEPEVAAAWFPVNDHPQDKATYTIQLTVPAGLEAISNGRLLSHSAAGAGWTRWIWTERVPMASYLALVSIGQFDIRRWTTGAGLPVLDAVDPRVGDAADNALAMQGDIVDFLVANFGPYPFEAVGGVVDYHELWAALENQTRPLYDWRFFGGEHDEFVVVHELAHQWYGDSVAVHEWKHIWLNEGFATYAEWLWSGAQNLGMPQEIFDFFCSIPDDDPLWEGKVGDPTVAHLFDALVYYRGAMTLQALRNAVGDADFFAILRSWAAERRNGTGTTAQFQALAETISGEDLDDLFTEFLFTAGKPASCGSGAAAAMRAVAQAPIFRTATLWRTPAGFFK
jgi:aminopeptidase N